MSVHIYTSAATRSLALSTFVSTWIDSLHQQEKHKCSACQTQSPDLKRCSRCRCARYCNRDCQKDHFQKGHKKVCKKWAEIYERYEGNPIQGEMQLADLFLALGSFLFQRLIEESPVMKSFKDDLDKQATELSERMQNERRGFTS